MDGPGASPSEPSGTILSETGAAAPRAEGITLELVQAHPELSTFISAADRVMEGLGYTEHGFRHANLCARIAYQVLSRLEFDERTAALGCVAGYLHDGELTMNAPSPVRSPGIAPSLITA